MKRTILIAALSAAALTTATGLLVAGPLNPPAGSVASSYKTLTEVEPRSAISSTNTPGSADAEFVISTRGSYYLTANITAHPGKFGIRINCSEVNLDLNGFTITGGVSGVAAPGYPSGIVVRNGTILYPTGVGVDLRGCSQSRVEQINVDSYNNAASDSIYVSEHSVVTDCEVYGGSAGIGIHAADSSIVERCTVASCGSHGYELGAACRVRDCTAAYCSGDGFHVSGANGTITDCVASQCSLNGFESTDSYVFQGCTTFWNSNAGFKVAPRSTVRECTADSNTLQGITCQGRCDIIGNQVRDNGAGGAAGIWAQGDRNRIDNNDLSNNGYGVYISGAANLVVRNHCSANSTNFYIPAGNHVGVILTPTTTAALINGSSGGGLGTSDPNANFVY
ncbi:MAG: right-handed parallel beta-helix repeat-containing protein [Planctomycetes bacterium]|nr:right-handed parallel beta-helix repeat-containing protein [Planctomycetota bacterium]